MINHIEIIFGSILALIASVILGLLLGSIGSYLGFFVVSILIGYSNGEDIFNGALYGIFICLIAGLIFTISMILMLNFTSVTLGASMLEFGLSGIVIGLIIDAIIGAVGGALGVSIRYRNI